MKMLTIRIGVYYFLVRSYDKMAKLNMDDFESFTFNLFIQLLYFLFPVGELYSLLQNCLIEVGEK